MPYPKTLSERICDAFNLEGMFKSPSLSFAIRDRRRTLLSSKFVSFEWFLNKVQKFSSLHF
jgi:hypothetical protein